MHDTSVSLCSPLTMGVLMVTRAGLPCPRVLPAAVKSAAIGRVSIRRGNRDGVAGRWSERVASHSVELRNHNQDGKDTKTRGKPVKTHLVMQIGSRG